MASAHIEIGRDTRHAQNLRSLVDSFTALRNNITNIKAVYDQIAMGGDYAALAVALNLTGDVVVTTQQAQDIYNLLGSVATEQADDTFTAQFLSRLG